MADEGIAWSGLGVDAVGDAAVLSFALHEGTPWVVAEALISMRQIRRPAAARAGIRRTAAVPGWTVSAVSSQL